MNLRVIAIKPQRLNTDLELKWLLAVSSVGSVCTLSAFTNPRRAIDGINGSLLSVEQGEALRMRRRASFFFFFFQGKEAPAVPPSPVVGLCLGRNGFGASGGSQEHEPELNSFILPPSPS